MVKFRLDLQFHVAHVGDVVTKCLILVLDLLLSNKTSMRLLSGLWTTRHNTSNGLADALEAASSLVPRFGDLLLTVVHDITNLLHLKLLLSSLRIPASYLHVSVLNLIGLVGSLSQHV